MEEEEGIKTETKKKREEEKARFILLGSTAPPWFDSFSDGVRGEVGGEKEMGRRGKGG